MFFTILGVIVAILIICTSLWCAGLVAIALSDFGHMDTDERIVGPVVLIFFCGLVALFAYPLFFEFPFNITFSLAMVK